MCMGRVSSGKSTRPGIQRRGMVGVVASSSTAAWLSESKSPRYCEEELVYENYLHFFLRTTLAYVYQICDSSTHQMLCR